VLFVDAIINPTNSDPDHVGPGNLGWQQLISAGNEPAAPINQLFKNSHINYKNLGPIYGTEDVANNRLLLDMMDIPNAILQMVYNKLYVPLSMLTTSALSKIQMNNNLKFRKIPFGNGIGKQSLDESSFPLEDLLTETYFFQAYRNWLMVIDIIATPDVAVGWYEHHSRMLRDDKFNAFFDAWWDMDKQLCSQFITCPFQIDPYSATYIQLLERSRMNFFFAHAEKAQQMFDLQQWLSRYSSRPM